jgi:hypothetical protein
MLALGSPAWAEKWASGLRRKHALPIRTANPSLAGGAHQGSGMAYTALNP